MKKIIVDVRTEAEWNEGHAPCSVHIPLDTIETKADELRKYDEIVVVCRSGARSGHAKMLLEEMGLTNIENLGPWQNVQC